jgi:hypothetical protein
MIKPSLFRQYSGINTNALENSNYKLVRALTMTISGEIFIDKFTNEIFKGFSITPNQPIREWIALSSTLILDDKNVTIASQVYDRGFNTTTFKDVNTYKEYFEHRAKQPKIERITWLGAPAIVFSYKNRNKLAKFLYGSSVINLMFWITSFSSNDCFNKFNENREKSKKILRGTLRDAIQDVEHGISRQKSPQETPEHYASTLYCDRYEEIKNHCNNEIWQKNNTYKNFYENKGKRVEVGKFLTNFDDCIKRVEDEEHYLEKYNTDYRENTKKYVQRYNEMYSYIYPWDIEGIEVGAIDKKGLTYIKTILEKQRKQVIIELEDILKNFEESVEMMNTIIDVIISNPDYATEIYNNIIQSEKSDHKMTFTLFLLTKLILLSRCNIAEIFEKKLFRFPNEINENIKGLVSAIIKIMNEPLKIFEYTYNESNGFKMKTLSSLDRKSDFVLFEFTTHPETNILNTYKSDKQLIGTISIPSHLYKVPHKSVFNRILSKIVPRTITRTITRTRKLSTLAVKKRKKRIKSKKVKRN